MNISYNWLKTYLNLDLTPEEVGAALTSIGLETGGIEERQSIRGGLEGIVIGKVLTCREHPNSDHLHITTVDLGAGEPVQIVCGAPNVAAGQHVVVATVGTTLYAGDESFTIKKSKIRGEESFGMICAEDEIGIGSGHDGIIVLPDSAVPGTPAKTYYHLESDYILEVDITPNRVDAASHYGVARDLAAYLKRIGRGGVLNRPSVEAFHAEETSEGAVRVRVENSTACPRYCGITITGITVGESPDWLKQRLSAIGLRPINNIVDITNFLLHETGQPLHCFDRAKIKGNEVVVRNAREGDKFVTLDGVERTLSADDLMICNSETSMCIAGVFGGLDSGVTEATTDVFIESAYFHPTSIRKTARRHGLNTDASFRYERGADPNNLIYVLKRAVCLIQELAGGKTAGPVVDIYPQKTERFPVTLHYDKVNRLIGKTIEPAVIRSILESLEIEIVSENETTLELRIPTYRVDVQREVDVIEDILRIYGYNNIDFTDSVHSNLSYKTATDTAHGLQNEISERLTGCGFNEIMNNSLTRSAYYETLRSLPENHCVKLLNPLSNDLNVMRQTLLFGGLESIAYNLNRKRGDIRFYEFGNCYFYDESARNGEKTLAPYREESRLALWMAGNSSDGSWERPDEKSSFFELKAYVEQIFTALGISPKRLQYAQSKGDTLSEQLTMCDSNNRLFGEMGIVSPRILKNLEIETDVFYAELNWKRLLEEAVKTDIQYREITRFPAVKRDLALLVDQAVSFGEIERIAYDTERKLLKTVTLFDVYEGKNLEPGKKSYAVSFLLRDSEKTLNDKQIENCMKRIQTALEQRLEAQLR